MKVKTMVAFATLLILSALQFIRPSSVYACYCVPLSTPQFDIQRSTAIFSGKATSVDMVQLEGPNGGTYQTIRVIFQVATIWKGSPNPEIEVQTATQSTACGYEFKVGETYLVYSYDFTEEATDNNQTTEKPVVMSGLHTSICTRTALLSSAGEDLAVLGPGTLPDELPLSEKLLRILPQAAGIILIAGAYLLFKKVKRSREALT